MAQESIAGYRFASEEGPVKRSARGRVCEEAGCSTILSIYNDGDHCARHEPMTPPRMRGVKIA
ncbi:MAG: hypothetical protein ACKVWR_21680 [Acidimicrobiales bacterium]